MLLAVSLMGVGLRYPARRLRGVLAPTAVLVTAGMFGMAALSAGLVWLLLGVPVALAVLIGACITPTDPVLASSVVTGKPAEEHLPVRTRQILPEESGTNDGLALPLVLVGVALVMKESVDHAALEGLYQVGVGVAIGLVVGLLADRAVRYAVRHADVDQGSSLVFTLVLAVAVLGLARVADADGVLSVFVASRKTTPSSKTRWGRRTPWTKASTATSSSRCSCCSESSSPGPSGETSAGQQSCSPWQCCCCDDRRSCWPSRARWDCGSGTRCS